MAARVWSSRRCRPSRRSRARANGGNKFSVSVNFGFAELQQNFSKKETIKLTNNGSTPATFNVAQALPAGSPHTVSLNKWSVTVPAHGDAEVGNDARRARGNGRRLERLSAKSRA